MSRCFAYSKTGSRCEKDAGHDGLHTLSVTWDDDECFTPSTPPPMPTIPQPAAPVLPPPSAERCEVCDHRMHYQMCPVGDCDCRTGV